MNTQEILTSAIEGIFWLSVAFMIFQFITGLFVLKHKPYTVIQTQTKVTPKQSAMSFDKPQNVYAPTAYCYEELPDPWTLPIEEVDNTNSAQTVVVSFPTLRLLPPVKENQSLKRTTRPKKTESYSSKSTKKADPNKEKRKVKPRKVA